MVKLSPALPLLGLLVALPAAALAAPPAAKPDPDKIDITPYRDKLKFLADKDGHMIAVVRPFSADDEELEPLFYSLDGKVFYQQRRIGAFADGDKSYEITYWDPGAGRPGPTFTWQDGKYAVTCETRVTEFTPVAADRIAALRAAEFRRPLWKRQAYTLPRDDTGVYYYVDQGREEKDAKDFRVYRGPKGSMKQMKMKNAVSDSEGDIFITEGGELRMVVDKGEKVWVAGRKRTELVILPVEDNIKMIYVDLGVYSGQRKGTPCDDL